MIRRIRRNRIVSETEDDDGSVERVQPNEVEHHDVGDDVAAIGDDRDAQRNDGVAGQNEGRGAVAENNADLVDPAQNDAVQNDPAQNDPAQNDPAQNDPDQNDNNDIAEGKWLSYSELMMDSYPPKSKMIYLKAYKMFERFLKSRKQFVPNERPTEVQLLNYFHYLRNEKRLAPTTMWSTYSRVNACVKRLYGFSLKEYVRITDVLKSFESGYTVKKASIFSPAEVFIN